MVDTLLRTCMCGHDRDTHHKEIEQAGEPRYGKPRPVAKTTYHACLASFCQCEQYKDMRT